MCHRLATCVHREKNMLFWTITLIMIFLKTFFLKNDFLHSFHLIDSFPQIITTIVIFTRILSVMGFDFTLCY